MSPTTVKAFHDPARRSDAPTLSTLERSLLLRFDRADLDIAERNLAMVALEGNVALVDFCKQGHGVELALGDALFEIVAAEGILKIFYSIDFVHAFFRS